MCANDPPPPSLLAQLHVTVAERLAETAIARLYKVQRATGETAVLKHYKRGDPGNEASGLAYLRAHAGPGVVQVYATTQSAVLMEYAPGPSLAQMAGAGQDRAAAERLGLLAKRLVSARPIGLDALPRLEGWFDALFRAQFAPDCLSELRKGILHAQQIARGLLDSQGICVALHGDLHHGNVHHSPRGDLAFDAKGLWGDPAYELANAFRHPSAQPDLVLDPDRIALLAQIWSDALDVSEARLIGWAAAKCALSCVWRAKGVVVQDKEAPLLARLLAHHARFPAR